MGAELAVDLFKDRLLAETLAIQRVQVPRLPLGGAPDAAVHGPAPGDGGERGGAKRQRRLGLLREVFLQQLQRHRATSSLAIGERPLFVLATACTKELRARRKAPLLPALPTLPGVRSQRCWGRLK